VAPRRLELAFGHRPISLQRAILKQRHVLQI
jgi:hypothetical protein